ncbi:hypothetical protein [Arenimonas sp.]|uniref:hypothetical protein n=1 Tax=Arenimonas sp. TaxID=1872635 RepID=UPI002E3354BC|nr:hypothetical protein [Arenimonas sp.]HEX4854773.1 hypothetical protein [Arenimonas sp.]
MPQPLIATLAYATLALTALYLLALGTCSLLRPGMARRFLLGHASSERLHYLELALRLLVGAALLVRAPAMLWPQAFTFAGWILVGTTLLLALVPWRRHQVFAQRTVPQALRFLPLLGVASLGLGAGLLYAIGPG